MKEMVGFTIGLLDFSTVVVTVTVVATVEVIAIAIMEVVQDSGHIRIKIRIKIRIRTNSINVIMIRGGDTIDPIKGEEAEMPMKITKTITCRDNRGDKKEEAIEAIMAIMDPLIGKIKRANLKNTVMFR
jgi:hypothetical protein